MGLFGLAPHVRVPVAQEQTSRVADAGSDQTEIGCGIAIMTGRPLRAALRCAVVLNITFVLCGEINPSAFYLVMEMVLLVAVADGTIGTHPTPPTRRTYAFAAALLILGGALVPCIRTLEPAAVITDPAIMLVFLALLHAATLVLRCSLAKPSTRSSTSSSAWARRLTAWAKARARSAPLVEITSASPNCVRRRAASD